MWVPGRTRTYSVACAAVRVIRGIDDDHVGAVELLAFQNVLQRHRVRLGRIAAHDHDGLGIANVVVAVGHRAVAPGIGYAGDGGGMTDARLMIGIVGPPERGELAVEVGGFVGEFGRAEPVDRFRSRLLAYLQQFVADLVDGLVPGDPVPLAVDELHRIAQTTLVQHIVANRRALAAMRTAIDRAVVIRLLADPYAVGDLTDDRAADRAMSAHVLAAGDLRARRRWGTGLCPAQTCERQCAERREAAGDEAGPAQEAAAVETAVRLALNRGSKRSVAGRALRSFDQHRRPLTWPDSG